MQIFNLTIPAWMLAAFAIVSGIGTAFALTQQRAGHRERLHAPSRLARGAQNLDNAVQIALAVWFAILAIHYWVESPLTQFLRDLSFLVMLIVVPVWLTIRLACRVRLGTWNLWRYSWEEE